MISLNRLNVFNAVRYRALTFPSYQPLLQSLNGSIVAIGAAIADEPVGLVLAEIQADQVAKILSIYVKPNHRQRGVGTALLTELEQVLRQWGCPTALMVYAVGKPTTLALEQLLHTCGWPAPEPRMLICRCDRRMRSAPWIDRASLPKTFTIFPWVELTAAERHAIQHQQETAPWIPESLVPFNYEQSMEPLNSVGLRYQGQVVGWVITQRFKPDTICYSCSFVRQDLQQRGRIIPLYAEAIKRHYSRPEIPNATWVVPYVYPGMVQFVQHRMAEYMTTIDEFRRSIKPLAAATPDADSRLDQATIPAGELSVAGIA